MRSLYVGLMSGSVAELMSGAEVVIELMDDGIQSPVRVRSVEMDVSPILNEPNDS